jgi:hypothetical protein
LAMREEILDHLNREPFVPFRIVLTSGQGFDITNPNLVAVGETIMHVMYPRSDRYAILRQNQIASLELLETAQ